MTTITKRILTVTGSDELRDILPQSGVFDMLDCDVELLCPPNAMTSEIERMVNVIESMINVTDVRVVGVPRSEEEETFIVTISNVPVEIAKGRLRG
jgi:hypothetical protein